MNPAAPAKPHKLSTINVLTCQPIPKNSHQMILETSAPPSLETDNNNHNNHISHIDEVQSPCRSLQIDNKYIKAKLEDLESRSRCQNIRRRKNHRVGLGDMAKTVIDIDQYKKNIP